MSLIKLNGKRERKGYKAISCCLLSRGNVANEQIRPPQRGALAPGFSKHFAAYPTIELLLHIVGEAFGLS